MSDSSASRFGGRAYALGQMFQHWVDSIRTGKDTAVLVCKDPDSTTHFLQLCADLTGLSPRMFGNTIGALSEPGGTIVAYAVSSIDTFYVAIWDLSARLVPVGLVMGTDPALNLFSVSVSRVDPDPVDSDGLYKAIPDPQRPHRIRPDWEEAYKYPGCPPVNKGPDGERLT